MSPWIWEFVSFALTPRLNLPEHQAEPFSHCVHQKFRSATALNVRELHGVMLKPVTHGLNAKPNMRITPSTWPAHMRLSQVSLRIYSLQPG